MKGTWFSAVSNTRSLTALTAWHVTRKYGIFSSADSQRGHLVLWVLLTMALFCCRMYATASIFALITAYLMSQGSVEEASQIRCGRFPLWDLFRKVIDDFASASSSISFLRCCWMALSTSSSILLVGRPYLRRVPWVVMIQLLNLLSFTAICL